MLQAGLPPSVLEELLASRRMTCVNALYQVLKTFQPGGLAERTRLLEALQSPGVGQNPKEVLEKLRLWMRHLNRALSMQISVPDSSILLKGLDGLCNQQLQKHAQTDFRMSVVRTRLSLDHAPTQASVSEYAKALQSEFSMLVLASIEDQKGPKLKKIGDQAGSTGKGSEQKGADGKSGTGTGSGKKPCKHWFTNAGCPWAAKCTFAHSQAVTKGSGRCFSCSGLGHSKPNCPYKDGKGVAGSSGKDKGAEGSSKGKGETAAKKVDAPGAGSSSEAGPDAGKGGTGVANPVPTNAGDGNVQAQLLREATEALKALALRAMRSSDAPKMVSSEKASGLLIEMAFCQEPVIHLAQCESSGSVGLLDSGASVCLRQPRPGELDQCIKRQVTLAVGRQCMWVNPLGTIMSEEAVEPIVSLPQLIAVGYKFRWTSHGVELRNPKNQKVPVSLNGFCPEVSRESALQLIAEIEDHLLQGRLAKERVARLVAQGGSEKPSELLIRARQKLLDNEDPGAELRLWLAKVFPQVPEGLLDQVTAAPSLDGENAPWNRRQRRSMMTAKGGILVHLFSGSTIRGKFRAVAAKHKLHLLDIDIGEDLTRGSTYAYLIALALCGRIKGAIGGPPCRTYSPCRLLPGGPPVVRTRTGPYRWGREGLSPKEAAKVATDNVLTVRMAALAMVSYESSLQLGLGVTANLAEHPRDPIEYRKDLSPEKLPALFKTPEWEAVKKALGLQLVPLNQGPLGHERVKPTHLCTNLNLAWLTPATAGVEDLNQSADTSRSSEWASWAPGLVGAISDALDEFFREKPPKVCSVATRDEERMRRHVRAGHLPYWKRCRACLEGRARDRPHMRQGVIETSVLSLDLAGPFRTGRDEDQQPTRYALTAVFTVADLNKLQELEDRTAKSDQNGAGTAEDGNLGPGEDKDGEDRFGAVTGDDEWLEGSDDDDGPAGPDDASKDLPLDGEGEYLLQNLPTKELVFTEVLPSKQQSTVLEAIRTTVARIAGLGYKICRIHNDKGREFMARSVQSWASARGYSWSNTGADNWKSNGRVESCIGRLKGMTTTLLAGSGLDDKDWGFAWRHAAERMLRNTLYELGGVTSCNMVPFGTKLLVKQRSWRVKDWSPKVSPAVVLAPAKQVANAWRVRTESGEFVTTAVLFPNIVEPGVAEDAKQINEDVAGPVPPRRYRQKTAVKAIAPNQAPRTPSPNQAPRTPSVGPAPNQAPRPPSPNQAPRTPSVGPDPNQVPRTPSNHPTTLSTRQGNPSSLSPTCVPKPLPSEDADGQRVAKLRDDRSSGDVPTGVRISASAVAAPSENARWIFPQGCSSNEELLKTEDAVAHSLATGSAYTFARACQFVSQSWWGKTTTGAIKQGARTELHRVLGMYQHGGIIGITNSTQCYPGFTRLLARVLRDCWPEQCFTSLALVTCAEIAPHKDKFNLPGSNLLLPLKLPKGGLCLWSELKTSDLVTGRPATRILANGQLVSGQEQYLQLGQIAQLDAKRWHGASAIGSGTTLCLVAYTLGSYHKLPLDEQQTLTASGFRLPTAVQQQGGGNGGSGKGDEGRKNLSKVGSGPGGQGRGWESLASSEPGPRTGGNLQEAECWRAERGCSICAVKYDQALGTEGDDYGLEVWDEGPCESWFLVDGEDAALRRVDSACSSNSEWALVASEVPLGDRSQGKEVLAPELDELQCQLKKFMSGERPRFRVGIEVSDQEEVLGTAACLCQVSQKVRRIEQELTQLRGLGLEGEASVGDRVEDPVEVLQTRTIPTDQALAEWDDGWGDAAVAEAASLVTKKQALEDITEGDIQQLIDQGVEVVRLPMKLVFTLKAMTSRKKCRIVLCGNQEPARDESPLERKLATYAGGVDLGLLRLLIAEAVAQQYSMVAFDIATAFLNAPARPRNLQAAASGKQQVIIGIPPRALVRKGIIRQDTLWRVWLAVYGRDSSPRDWALHRTETLSTLRIPTSQGVMRLHKSTGDSSVWIVYREGDDTHACQGWIAIYVDDFLGAGKGDVPNSVYNAVNNVWECGSMETVMTTGSGKPVRFDGLELVWSPDYSEMYVGQPSYITDLVSRCPEAKPQSVPLVRQLLEDEPDEPSSPGAVKRCQKLLGELLYLAARSRPDIAYPCSRLASCLTKRPKEVFELALGVVGYLMTTQHLGLIYRRNGNPEMVEAAVTGQHRPLLEVFSDAGFAPQGLRSQECSIAFWRDSAIFWYSSRQPFVAQSTCEAELLTIVSASNLGESFIHLTRELGSDPRCVSRNDNSAAVLLASSECSAWRTRHLRIRANVLREKVAAHQWEVYHVPGARNPADIGTKVLPGSRLEALRQLIGMGQPPQNRKASGDTIAQIRRVAGAMYAIVLSACVPPSEGARPSLSEEAETGDWVLWLSMVVWTIAAIAVWEFLRWVVGRIGRVRREPDPEINPEGPLVRPPPPIRVAPHLDFPSPTSVGTPTPEPFEEPVSEDAVFESSPVRAPPHMPEPEAPTVRQPYLPVYGPEPDPEIEAQSVHPPPVPPDDRPPNVDPTVEPQQPRAVRVVPYEEVQRRANLRNQHGLLNNPPQIPLRFNVFWPLPVQPILRDVHRRRSDWGGDLSAIFQVPPDGTRDFYEYPSAGRVEVLTRWHGSPRVRMFTPMGTASPVPLNLLSGRRRTVATLRSGETELLDDTWQEEPGARRHLTGMWRGRTELEVYYEGWDVDTYHDIVEAAEYEARQLATLPG